MDVLRNYFLKEAFKTEINFDNVMGSKGEVVTRFAELLNSLWNKSKSISLSPSRLKNAIGKANSMFKGDAQHDS
jgi:ubiquitin C-terminal hydrolase